MNLGKIDPGIHTRKVSLNSYSDGYYIVQLNLDKGKTLRQKLLINRRN